MFPIKACWCSTWDRRGSTSERTLTGRIGRKEFTISDLDVTVGGDIAYSHSIQHISATDKNGKPAELTVRVTDGYKKVDGKWLIAQEHVSVPFDLETLKPDLTSKP